MPLVRTVLGDIDSSALGVTDAHDHLLIRSGLVLTMEPGFRLDSVDVAVREVRDFQKFGGQALVDTAPLGFGRDPEGLVAIARQTGLHVIACTGFLKPGYYLDSHWRNHYSTEEIASLLSDEIERGMDQHGYEGPLVKRSAARAGAIKVASDYQVVDRRARVAFEAAVIAHRATGAPILTHTEIGTMALEQVKLLELLGVQPAHVVLSHVDRNPDWIVHRDVAQTGVFLEYDGAGRAVREPPETNCRATRVEIELAARPEYSIAQENT
jgi:phosphotriesterase-related protein